MEKTRFLHSEFLTLSLLGTFQHNKIYKAGVSEQERKQLQGSLKQKLIETSCKYKKPVSDSTHEGHIKSLADQLSSEYSHILQGRFRIGTAQKALNLFLKYLWCAGEISTPPHCPLDFRIIQKLPSAYHNVKWTQLDDLSLYQELITAAKACAAPDSLAEWELKEWNAQGGDI